MQPKTHAGREYLQWLKNSVIVRQDDLPSHIKQSQVQPKQQPIPALIAAKSWLPPTHLESVNRIKLLENYFGCTVLSSESF